MKNPYRRHWTLDPEVTFLNHGSYGACPARIQLKQQELRQEMEREPVRFMGHRTSLLDHSRARLAEFLGAPMTDLAFVPNATHGVNAAIGAQRWQPGDEVLVTDHEYNACRNALDFSAERSGAIVVVVKLPFPLTDPQQVVEAMMAKVTKRTVFCLVDHITSPTALVLPVAEIIQAMRNKGIRTLVDGAHAPGQLPLNLEELGADYYTGNLHKWVCAPKGSAFLYVRPELQEEIHPVTISHGYNAGTENRSRFLQEFDWTGTFDPTAWGSVAHVLDFMEDLVDGGWNAIMKRNHELTLSMRTMLAERFGTGLPAPDSMIGTMASLFIPSAAMKTVEKRGTSIYTELQNQWGIQIPAIPLPDDLGTVVRFSVHIYNTESEYHRLAEAIESLV
ncbi:MAG: aminotransferase class V-fold PLP-dependent enzyme [Planctomycetota bacterium]|nr:aminotransferase class V-fold PLP-dependent enzyme [Planctomycetota bacterium]MDA1114240.1 aminotransferase class V-fold PLP-dependent enzyme [Planctomycetota bacterium]